MYKTYNIIELNEDGSYSITQCSLQQQVVEDNAEGSTTGSLLEVIEETFNN